MSITNDDFSIYSKGNWVNYSGELTSDAILSWINKRTRPLSKRVNCATMQAFTAKEKLSMSFFGAAAEGAMWDSYMQTAYHPDIIEKYMFFHTTDESCSSNYGATAPGLAITR